MFGMALWYYSLLVYTFEAALKAVRICLLRSQFLDFRRQARPSQESKSFKRLSGVQPVTDPILLRVGTGRESVCKMWVVRKLDG